MAYLTLNGGSKGAAGDWTTYLRRISPAPFAGLVLRDAAARFWIEAVRLAWIESQYDLLAALRWGASARATRRFSPTVT